MEISGDHGSLYLYGPDADKLFATVRKNLADAECLKKPKVFLRYGAADNPNAKQHVIDLTAQ